MSDVMSEAVPARAPIAPLRVSIDEAAAALRMSRALLYRRIRSGDIASQHEGRRSYITVRELERYVAERAA
jgi:Helix-turn-helix domain